MIRRSGISLYWPSSLGFMMVLVIGGCDSAPPSVTSTHDRRPTADQAVGETAPESIAQVAEPEMASSPKANGAKEPSTAGQAPAKTNQKPVAAAPAPAPSEMKTPKVALSVPEPPEYVYEPQVLMSQRHVDSSLVKVGDSFPFEQLPDLEGQERSLKELLGEKLTVIVFWANSNRLGREQIQRLEAETVLPFENTGVSVVAINTSDPPEQIRDLLPTESDVGFTILFDTDAKLFSKVATGGHPRTYLLDATGNVLWFDIEYSRSTARDLANAIHVYLGGRKTSES